MYREVGKREHPSHSRIFLLNKDSFLLTIDDVHPDRGPGELLRPVSGDYASVVARVPGRRLSDPETGKDPLGLDLGADAEKMRRN